MKVMKKSVSLAAGIITGTAVIIAAMLMQDGWDVAESSLLLTCIASTVLLFTPDRCSKKKASDGVHS